MKFMKIIIIAILLNNVLVFSQTRYEIKIDNYDFVMKYSRDRCLGEMGKTEKGNNTGEHIRLYHKYVSLNYSKRYPYCAMGQCWSFGDYIPFKRSASANRVFDNIRKQGYKTDYKAHVNDLLVWKHIRKYKGHIERIDTIYNNNGWVGTLAFNTSPQKGSQDNGGGNYKKKRNIYHPLARLQVRGLVGFAPLIKKTKYNEIKCIRLLNNRYFNK